MERIIWHWTAGGHWANAVDRRHYHFVIQVDGSVVEGDKEVADNLDVHDGDYAAHTRRLNTGSIGIALAGMHGARDYPFRAGDAPITERQIDALAELTADLCRKHSIPVSRTTVLSHAEVPSALGVAQPGKWDISWLPGMAGVGDPVVIGDTLRNRVLAKMTATKPSAARKPGKAEKVAGPAVIIGIILAGIAAFFGLGG